MITGRRTRRVRSITVPLLASVLVVGCGPRVVPDAPRPAPAPSTRPLAAAEVRRPSPPSTEMCRCITICFVQNGRLQNLFVTYSIATRDTLTRDLLPLSQGVRLPTRPGCEFQPYEAAGREIGGG